VSATSGGTWRCEISHRTNIISEVR